MHQPGYSQEGQEVIFGRLLLGVYYRNSPSSTHIILSVFYVLQWKLNNNETTHVEDHKVPNKKVPNNTVPHKLILIYKVPHLTNAPKFPH